MINLDAAMRNTDMQTPLEQQKQTNLETFPRLLSQSEAYASEDT